MECTPTTRRGITRDNRERAMMSVLSGREREVMHLICRGLQNAEIARQLNLSEETVRVHLHNIFRKLAVRNRAALARKRNGQPPGNAE